MRAIAVINQKGGVGKTTTTANLAHALVLAGYKVTAIDLDPQGHLAAHLGAFEREQQGIDQLMLGEKRLNEVITEVRDGLRLIPAGSKLDILERGGGDEQSSERLQNVAITASVDQDFIFIDCPPASGLLIDYALAVVDEIIVPVAGDYLALRGLSDLIATLKRFEEKYTHPFTQWIIVTRFHSRRRLSSEVRDKLVEYFPRGVLETPIRETSVLAECPSFGKTVFEYKRGNNGAMDYESLARNFLNGEYFRGEA